MARLKTVNLKICVNDLTIKKQSLRVRLSEMGCDASNPEIDPFDIDQ